MVDEAGYVPFLYSVLPLMMGGGQLVCLGDKKQLSCYTAAQVNQYSLLDFMAERGVRVNLLTVSTVAHIYSNQSIDLKKQFRMHPAINSIISHHFYNDQLIDCTSQVSGCICPFNSHFEDSEDCELKFEYPYWKSSFPIMLINTITVDHYESLYWLSLRNLTQVKRKNVITLFNYALSFNINFY